MRLMTAAITAAALAWGCGDKKTEKKDEPAAEPATAATTPAEPGDQTPAARPASLGDEDVALVEDWAALYSEYASAMESAGLDCAKATAAVRDVNKNSADLIAKGKAKVAQFRGDPAVAKWLDDNYKMKLGAELDRMAPTLDKCRGVKEFSAAMADGAFERKAK